MCDYWAGGHLLQRNFEDELDVRTRQYHHKTAPNLKQAAADKHAVSNWCGSAKAVSKTNPSRRMAADKPAPEIVCKPQRVFADLCPHFSSYRSTSYVRAVGGSEGGFVVLDTE